MVLGNPSGAGTSASNYLIQRPQYALGYVSSSGIPKWVSWSLTSGDQGREQGGQLPGEHRSEHTLGLLA